MKEHISSHEERLNAVKLEALEKKFGSHVDTLVVLKISRRIRCETGELSDLVSRRIGGYAFFFGLRILYILFTHVAN